MRKFTFKLEPLFNYRQRLEEAAKKEFSEAVSALEAEDERLRSLREDYRRQGLLADAMKEQNALPREIEMHTSYLGALKRAAAEQEKRVIHFREAVEVKRNALLDATKDRKVIETMREKAFALYADAMNIAEQKASDDLATTRFRRRSNEP